MALTVAISQKADRDSSQSRDREHSERLPSLCELYKGVGNEMTVSKN